MVAAKEIVNARAMADPDPAAVFEASNRRLYEIKRRMFVSLSYFLLDPKSLSMTYAFAGQPTPLLVRPGSRDGGRDSGAGRRGCPSAPSATRATTRRRSTSPGATSSSSTRTA